MNDPWYQPRFVTMVAAILLMASFIALNTWETDKGVFRVYLDEGEKLCVAYRAKARGWPETFSTRYVLDEEATTLLGYPHRKFIDDEYNNRPLCINVVVAGCAFASLVLVIESLARLIALRPKKIVEEPRRRRLVSEVRAVSADQNRSAEGEKAVEAATPGAGGRPITAKQGAKTGRPLTSKQNAKPAGRPLTSKQNAKPGGRPASIKQKPKVEVPLPRLSSVKPALVAARQAEVKRLAKT